MYRFVRERSFEPGTLGAASFWVGLRQEIYSAVTKRQPVCLNLVHPGLINRSLDQTDDYAWANLAVVHCADVVNLCFDPEKHHPESWDELDEWNRRWAEKQPRSYDPVFRGTQGSAVFPEIWYHRSCQGKLTASPSLHPLHALIHNRLSNSHWCTTSQARKALFTGPPDQVWQLVRSRGGKC